ncbi:MAG: DUF6324 family protein [Rhodobacteraceae bacterium]|jgi:hypothetical protein|nr:DUF6324 family protein [Paracoccaceae bacterium]
MDDDSDIAASLTVGPTDRAMVRIVVEGEGFRVPMDFEPDEADEIAEELRLAAEAARGQARTTGRGRDGTKGPGPRRGA